MDPAAALVWVGGSIGGAVACYGVWMLLSGRMPAGTRRAFRRATDAGMYAICTGSAFALLAAADRFPQFGKVSQVALVGVATLLGVLGFIKYRPRRDTGEAPGQSPKFWEP